MSVESTAEPSHRADLAALPTYELDCLFDDHDDPSEVTIFYPRGERTVSEWVTADVGSARSLDEVR